MPLIIAATDFSEVANNAVKYACTMAEAHTAAVSIIHSYTMPVMFSDIPIPGNMLADAENDLEKRMEALVTDMRAQHPTMQIDGKIVFGDTISTLEELAENATRAWMVVVGNSATADNGWWIDSTMWDAFKRLDYPVLAVPNGVAYSHVSRIGLAFDNKHEGNEVAMEQLKATVLRMKNELHVLHVQADTHHRPEGTALDSFTIDMLARLEPKYHLMHATDNIEEAIFTFLESEQINWLAMIPRKHSLFEWLFQKSHTKEIARQIAIPVLILHDR